MPTAIDEIFARALKVKLDMDEVTRLGDKLYYCAECGQISGYWKFGQVCAHCEYIGERQQEEDHEN